MMRSKPAILFEFLQAGNRTMHVLVLGPIFTHFSLSVKA